MIIKEARGKALGFLSVRLNDFLKECRAYESPTPPMTQAAGAKTKSNLTITPAKQTASTRQMAAKIMPSVAFLQQQQSPAGASISGRERSWKYETQEVAQCSETEAMIGMYFFAQVGSNRVMLLPLHWVFPWEKR